ncbi:hypothetical protein F3N42_11305 [Marinihelvus fidelis]|uniref:Nuclear transport factor 2 family protein n=1 Tax=Marinihelvus fidelis TaxID=2613842 RepID=A0A5N0T7H0_9GAMM|nr:hypothetical protein [Marinihelvus fidelis]KAA9130933.1 hypothetical protein F3N42_11305 [Marinihelvus fidelis]
MTLNLRAAFLLLLVAVMAAGCHTPKQDKSLDETLSQYESMVRWSEWDGAVGFVAPDFLEKHPITRLDVDRLRLFRVTNYTVRSGTPIDGGEGFVQVVEIRMYNKNRAVEQVVMDQQEWRWDAVGERWMLHSGLPDVTRRY